MPELNNSATLQSSRSVERTEDSYSVRLDTGQAPPVLTMKGSVRVTEPRDLKAFFGQVHEALRSTGAAEVRVDLQDLEFLNSTAFKPLVHWLALIEELPTERRYKVRFRIAPQRHWQRPCLGALSCFAPLLVVVEAA